VHLFSSFVFFTLFFCQEENKFLLHFVRFHSCARMSHVACKGGEEEGGDQESSCLMLEMLPQELLCAIFSFVVGESGDAATRDLAAWCLTCATFNALCDDETRHRCRCLAAWPVLFGLALSPVFGAPLRALSPASAARRAEDAGREGRVAEGDGNAAGNPVKLSWKLRAQLLSHLPSRLVEAKRRWYTTEEDEAGIHVEPTTGVDVETGRKHTNQGTGNTSLLADHPFVTTNRKALADALAAVGDEAADGWLDAVLFRGVEYFEMTVIHNTPSYNKAAAIGISQFFHYISFLGWNRTSIGYHSDDGFIHGGVRRSEAPQGRTVRSTSPSLCRLGKRAPDAMRFVCVCVCVCVCANRPFRPSRAATWWAVVWIGTPVTFSSRAREQWPRPTRQILTPIQARLQASSLCHHTSSIGQLGIQ
jgi:hypothetical protein